MSSEWSAAMLEQLVSTALKLGCKLVERPSLSEFPDLTICNKVLRILENTALLPSQEGGKN